MPGGAARAGRGGAWGSPEMGKKGASGRKTRGRRGAWLGRLLASDSTQHRGSQLCIDGEGLHYSEYQLGIEVDFQFQSLNHPNSGIWCSSMPTSKRSLCIIEFQYPYSILECLWKFILRSACSVGWWLMAGAGLF
jgi:hypothetical protein